MEINYPSRRSERKYTRRGGVGEDMPVEEEWEKIYPSRRSGRRYTRRGGVGEDMPIEEEWEKIYPSRRSGRRYAHRGGVGEKLPVEERGYAPLYRHSCSGASPALNRASPPLGRSVSQASRRHAGRQTELEAACGEHRQSSLLQYPHAAQIKIPGDSCRRITGSLHHFYPPQTNVCVTNLVLLTEHHATTTTRESSEKGVQGHPGASLRIILPCLSLLNLPKLFLIHEAALQKFAGHC